MFSAAHGPLPRNSDGRVDVKVVLDAALTKAIGSLGTALKAGGFTTLSVSMGSNLFAQTMLNEILSAIGVMQIVSHLMLIGI